MSRYDKKHKKPRQFKLVRRATKLLLNLTILAGLGMLIRYGYLLFTHEVDPLIGSIVFIVGITAWLLLIKLLRTRYKWTKPSFKLTTFSVIAILLIFTFAGVKPLATYKDNFIESYKTAQAERAAEEEARKTKEALEEVEREKQKIVELEHNVVELVNFIRTDRGSAPLIWDAKLYSYSKEHSESMAREGRLFHTPMEKPYAENAWGGEGSAGWKANDIVESWLSSPKHRTWLLCPHLKHVAIGIVSSDSGMYASWTFWRSETQDADWWYVNDTSPPSWWH